MRRSDRASSAPAAASSLRVAIAAAATRAVLKEGWVFKSSGFLFKSWKPRYVVVTAEGVQYFLDEQDTRTGRPPKGTVDMDGLAWSTTDLAPTEAPEPSARFAFQLQFPSSRLSSAADSLHTFYFVCTSDEEREQWILALEAAQLLWHNQLSDDSVDDTAFDKVGLLRKYSGLVRRTYRWRFFCLEFNQLRYSRRMRMSDFERTILLADASCHPRVQEDAQGGAPLFCFDIVERANRSGEPATHSLLASNADEMYEWIAAITIASKLHREVPLCMLYAQTAPARYTPVAFLVLGTWRRRANDLLRAVEKVAPRLTETARGAAGGAWNVCLSQGMSLAYAVHGIGAGRLAFAFATPADLPEGTVQDVFDVLRDQLQTIERELEATLLASSETIRYEVPPPMARTAPLTSVSLGFESSVGRGPPRLQVLLYESLRAVSPNNPNAARSAFRLPGATPTSATALVTGDLDTANVLQQPELLRHLSPAERQRDIFVLHTLGAPATPGGGTAEEPASVAELREAFATCRANFHRTLPFVEVAHQRAVSLRCPSHDDETDFFVTREPVVQRLYVDRASKQQCWEYIQEGSELQRIVARALSISFDSG